MKERGNELFDNYQTRVVVCLYCFLLCLFLRMEQSCSQYAPCALSRTQHMVGIQYIFSKQMEE